MTQSSPDENSPPPLLSVDEAEPSEEGGPIARAGFNYQDEVAVGFLIQLLEDPNLQKVHCETHDDVILVYEIEGSAARMAEYVQVKAHTQDKFWSVADLCRRTPPPAGSKTAQARPSIYETSLAKDKCLEDSRFRLVTLRDVTDELKLLTLPRDAPGRDPTTAEFSKLQSELDRRSSSYKSPKQNGADFWIQRCFWDVRHGQVEIRRHNLLRVITLSSREGRPLLPDLQRVAEDVSLLSSLWDERVLRGSAQSGGCGGAEWDAA